MTAPTSRPRPILKVAGIVGGSLTAVGVAATALVTAGVVPGNVGTIIAAVLAVVLPLGSALGVWTFSEGQVTPLASPQGAMGEALNATTVVDVAKALEPALFSFMASKYGSAGADVATQAASLKQSIANLEDDSKSIYNQMKAGA